MDQNISNEENIVKVFKKKSKAAPVATEERNPELFPPETIFTELIDLSDERLYDPNREKYKAAAKDRKTGNYSFVSVYMRADELEHLNKLAKKYNTSKAAVVRKLIVNSK